MVGRRFQETDSEKPPQGQRIFAPPGDSTLRIDALQLPDHQHPKVNARRNGGTATGLVVRLAQLFDEQIEPVVSEQAVELVVKDMPWTRRQSVSLQPELPLTV